MGSRTSASFVLLASVALQAVPALAQGSSGHMAPGDIASAASQAASTLASAGKDRLLVRDMLGAEVTGPGGQVIGTVENLVVIPGGRVVAVLIVTKDQNTGRVAVPYSAIKLSMARDKVGITVPMSLSDLTSNSQIQKLTQTVEGMTSAGQ